MKRNNGRQRRPSAASKSKSKPKSRSKPKSSPKSKSTPNENPQNPPPPLNSFMPNDPAVPAVPQMPQLNWSHFKPEYAGKPDEDGEANLLRTNNWMDMHEFPYQVRVQILFNFGRRSYIMV